METNAQLWTSALQQGAYRQTRGRLREKSKLPWKRPAFCAIGVLYDLYLKAHGERWPSGSTGAQLPQSVLDWAGIPRELESHVIAHNDGGRSFRDLAAIIEAYFHRAERERLWKESGRIAELDIEHARASSRTVMS